jgi:hypothetical protein
MVNHLMVAFIFWVSEFFFLLNLRERSMKFRQTNTICNILDFYFNVAEIFISFGVRASALSSFHKLYSARLLCVLCVLSKYNRFQSAYLVSTRICTSCS